MPVNDFLPFATGAAANVVAQSAWVTDPAVGSGFTTGVADSNRCNKAWRQSTFISAAIAQFVSQTLAQDVLDNGNLAQFVSQFVAALGTSTGAGGFVPEAPNDGIIYGRQSRLWHGPIIDQTALTNALLGYVKKIGDSMTGPLNMTGQPIVGAVLDGGVYDTAPVNPDHILLRRTTIVGNVPAGGSLAQGELAVEMAETTYPKLWVGVPTSVDSTGRRLVADLGQSLSLSGAYLPLTGGSLSGPLTMQGPATAGSPPTIYFNNPAATPGITGGGLWSMNIGIGGFLNVYMNQAASGNFSPFLNMLNINPNGDVSIYGGLLVTHNPNPTLTVSGGYTNLLGPDILSGSTDAGIMIGSTANATTFYRNPTHSFQSRAASATFATISTAGLNVTAGVTAGNLFTTNGTNAGLSLTDRTNQANSFIWYCSGNIAHLYTAGADRFTIDNGGNTLANGTLSAAGSITTQLGDLIIGRTTTQWGYLIRPTAQAYLAFAATGGAQLTQIWCNAALTMCGGGLSVGNNPTANLFLQGAGATGYTVLSTPDNIGSVFLGGASVPVNYYRNSTHIFQDRPGSTTFMQTQAAGTTITTGYFQVSGNTTLQGYVTVQNNMIVGGNFNCNNQIQAAGRLVSNWNVLAITGTGVSQSPAVGCSDGANSYGFWSSGYVWSFGETDSNGSPTGATNCQIVQIQTGSVGWIVTNGSGWKPGGGPWDVLGSSREYKKDIKPYERGLAAVCGLKPVTYKFNGLAGNPDDGKTYHGLIAEDVLDVMPEMVVPREGKLREGDPERSSKILGMSTNALSYALVNAVKELADRIEKLEGKG